MKTENSILPHLPPKGNNLEWGINGAWWPVHTMGHHLATKGEGPLLHAQLCPVSNANC